MSKPCEIVVVSSDLESRQRVAGALSRLGVNPICVSTIDQCRHIPKREKVGIVFCDKNVEGGDYQDVMAAVSSELADARPKIVMMSRFRMDPSEYRQAKRSGVFDIIESPCRPTDIEWMLISAMRARQNESKGLVASPRSFSPFGR